MSKDTLVAELRAGLVGVTPGPWRSNCEGKIHRLVGDGMWFAKISWTVTSERNEADATHIARCSPNNILILLDYIKSLESEVALLRGVEES